MKHVSSFSPDLQSAYDKDLAALDAAKHDWARTSVAERIALLQGVKDALLPVAEGWATTAARKKRIPAESPLVGEEWITGPYALMAGCNGLMTTLSQMEGKSYLKHLPSRVLPNGQTSVRVTPHSIWERLLLSGVTVDVWMQKGVNTANLAESSATIYDVPVNERVGKVALVLGAGNIASISPLDAFQKLFLENQVVLLKMNPVNDYLTEFLEAALKPLIDVDALRIVRGDGPAGAYLTEHPLVEELHITGARATHDAIVWGPGAEGEANRKAGTPKNPRPMTSELGAVCPTIVVPGPWNTADVRFQAEHIATMKLHNSGFNCVAVQSLILPKGWSQTEALMSELASVMARFGRREAYYPGAVQRHEMFVEHAKGKTSIDRGAELLPCALADMDQGDKEWLSQNEAFAPVLSTKFLEETDPEAYLRAAIAWANETLYGTLGGNILIHPQTIQKMGRKRFEEILAEFRYRTIAVNAWTGLGFLLAPVPWGGFAGATRDDVQSGVGTVHNSFMFEKSERTVVEAPFRPFPRNLLSGNFTLLPRPPWFISNRRADRVGKFLTRFQYKPGWLKLPRIFFHALLG